MRSTTAFGASAAVVFGCLIAVHAALSADIKPASGVTLLEASYQKTIILNDFFPRWRYAVRSLLDNPLPWLAVLAGLAMAVSGTFRQDRPERYRNFGLVGLALPLVVLFVYRNAFPYFYVMVLASAAAAPAALFHWMIDRREKLPAHLRTAMIGGCGLILALNFATHAGTHFRDETRGQRAVVDAIHRMFPKPVPYIDMCSMIASFPKVGFFMSGWGVEVYRGAGKPIMRRLIDEQGPVFVIANTEELLLSRAYEETGSSEYYRLLPEDFEILRANYVHHWGPLFVAGKKMRFEEGEAPRAVEILVPGTYTIEGAALSIDGKTLPPGSKVYLNKGAHIMGAESTAATVVLRWGHDLHRPDRDPPSPLFTNP
jgi:hypothetical protein